MRHDGRGPAGGLAAAEYVGLVAVVALVIGGLLVLRPHDAGRRPPVRPLPGIIDLIGAPVRPPTPPRTRTGPVRRPRPRPPRERHLIDVPRWLLG